MRRWLLCLRDWVIAWLLLSFLSALFVLAVPVPPGPLLFFGLLGYGAWRAWRRWVATPGQASEGRG